MAFWDINEGDKIDKASAAKGAELGGSSEPIPDGTKLRAMITSAAWDNHEGENYIKLRWDVIDGEYKKRVVFHKVKVEEADTKKRDKHKRMLAAIDFNCGGKLLESNEKPTDGSLALALCNKPMIIRVGVWDINGKKGNWVQAVESMTAPSAGATVAAAGPAPALNKPSADYGLDDVSF